MQFLVVAQANTKFPLRLGAGGWLEGSPAEQDEELIAARLFPVPYVTRRRMVCAEQGFYQ